MDGARAQQLRGRSDLRWDRAICELRWHSAQKPLSSLEAPRDLLESTELVDFGDADQR